MIVTFLDNKHKRELPNTESYTVVGAANRAQAAEKVRQLLHKNHTYVYKTSSFAAIP